MTVCSGLFQTQPVKAAEKIRIIYGGIELSLSIKALETYANSGEITEELGFYAQFMDETTLNQLRQWLQKRFHLNQTIIYRITNTHLIEELLSELGEVIQTHLGRNGLYAIRASLIQAAANPDGWTMIDVMRKFPSKNIDINGELVLQLQDELSILWDYRQAAERAIALEASHQAQSESAIDLSQLVDLRQLGKEKVTKQTLTIKKKVLRQTNQGLSNIYSFDVDLYTPSNLEKPAPVIVISHGFGSLRGNFAKIAEHLASYGYIVAVPEHIGSDLSYREELLQGNLNNAISPIEYINRPLDITYVLDELEKLASENPAWANKINMDEVGLIGDSLGGTTVLTLAGANINVPRLIQECKEEILTLNMSMPLQCRGSYLAPQTYNLQDKRIKAVMATHPVTSSIFGPEELGKIKIPILITAGSKDIIASVVEEQIHPFVWLKTEIKYLVLLSPGTHFTSSQPPENGETLPEVLQGKNRALGSSYVRGLSVAFFDVYLRDRLDYLPYLSAAYGEAISQEALKVDIIKSLTPSQIETAYGDRPPEAIIPPPVIAYREPRVESILEEIKKTGVLKVALMRDQAPFGYVDDQGGWIGYCSDLSHSLADYLVKQLKLPVSPQVVQILSNLTNRYDLVAKDAVYLECGPNTIRQGVKDVIFSDPFFVSGTHFLIQKSKQEQVNPNLNLEGIKIGLLRNTTTAQFIEKRYPKAEKVYFDNHTAEGIPALVNNQIDAFVNDGILLIAAVKEAKLSFEQYELVPKIPLTCDFYGLILPDDDSEWVDTVNAFLDTQEAQNVFQKSLGQFSSYSWSNLNYCLNQKK